MKRASTKAVLVVGLALSFSTVHALGNQRRSSLPAHLLKKVTKPKVKVSKKELSKSYFNIQDLYSKFSSWGVNPKNKKSSINLLGAWKDFSKKKEIVAAVVDTGIDPAHPFLSKNIYINLGKANQKNFGIDFSKNKSNAKSPSDSHGHGTHVSGIIKSVFPEVKILTLKYYNPKASGQDNLNATIEALRYAVKSNVDVINYSGGGPEPSLQELKILKEAERKGILVVAAAGNEESNIDVKKNAYYPASYGLKNIITVTAHDQNLQVLSSSNWGKRSVDISAPGYRIRSALPNRRAGYLTGTSQATAFVTGVVGLLKSKYPKLKAEEIKEIIKSSAKKEVTLLARCASGGRLDATKAMTIAGRYLKAKSLKKRSLANKDSKGKIFYRIAK